jgi:hypothetical protein
MTKDLEQTTVLSFPELVARVQKKHRSLSVNPRYAKEGSKGALRALEKLEKFRRRNVIRVDLEGPKEFVKQLRSNKVFRRGGILRKTNTKEIAKHLKEAKPSKVLKLAKVANIAFLAVDILESALLDEKLKAILDVVKSIEAKLEAQNKGKLKGALATMQELAFIQDPETKRLRINLIQNSLKECEWVFKEELENRWSKYSSSRVSFDSSKLTNSSELKEMQHLADSLVADLESVALCQVAHTQLYVVLNEYVAAEKGAEELLAFMADNVERFKNAFGAETLDIKQPKHKTILRIRRGKKFNTFREHVVEPNERIENLLNQMMIYSLTIPEEIVSESQKSGVLQIVDQERRISLWDRLSMLWLALIYRLKTIWRSQDRE